MKIVISIDSFKGSVNSLEAAHAVKEGILNIYSDSDIIEFPIADGGEGTVDALCSDSNGKIVKLIVTGPLGLPVEAFYGITESTNTAIIEMSSAAGLPLVPLNKRNPLYTTTYGVGQIIVDAINKGCRKFIIGIGGSATNDAGVGMLQALGFGFKDIDNNDIKFGAIGLKDICHIKCENVVEELSKCEFRIACDVKNPLFGPDGCSYVYGPQKGADDISVKQMDEWIKSYSSLVKNVFPKSDPDFPGCGAAGGMGYAFKTFLNAYLEPGVDIILSEIKIENAIKNADIVITGEGRLDSQTVMGKAPAGVAKIAKKYNKPVIAFSGCVADDANICNKYGIDAFFPILRQISTIEQALDKEVTIRNLSETAEQVFRLIKTVKNL